MDLVYFKRFRMEIALAGRDLTPGPPPDHYQFLPWSESLLDGFARAKYLGFRNETDTRLFPCLGEFEGCRRLMRDITERPGFVPEATWLVIRSHGILRRPEYCGTVQGVREPSGNGAIQNLGVAPEHRRSGLGAGLLLRSLEGFCRSGIACVNLEVTASNNTAIRLYRRLGFAPVRVVYKTVAEKEYSR